MDFWKVREKSVEIGKFRKLSKNFECHPEHVLCIPLAVVIKKTANGLRFIILRIYIWNRKITPDKLITASVIYLRSALVI